MVTEANAQEASYIRQLLDLEHATIQVKMALDIARKRERDIEARDKVDKASSIEAMR
jgi:hypothetical protein